MKYEIIEFTQIPDNTTFYYLSNEGKQIKCRKKGKWGFTYIEPKCKAIRVKRYCPFPDNWYCVRAIRKRRQ